MKPRPWKTPQTGPSRAAAHPADNAMLPAAHSLRLLIVDDHSVVSAGLEAMLSAAPGIGPIATAADGAEALRLCASELPDLVLLDLRMPVMDGHRTLEALRQRWPELRVVVISGSELGADVKLARRAGAAAFLSKSADPATVLQVIETVAAGGTYFPEAGESEAAAGCQLSPRELEVLRHLARGLTNDEIGRVLGVSGQTVKGHLKHLFPKLSAATRTEAVSRAYELGLVM